MSDNLLPCPFCGGPVYMERTVDERKWYGVVCRNTLNLGGSCAVSIRPSASEEAAVERWNRRAWQAAQSVPVVEEPVAWRWSESDGSRFFDWRGDNWDHHDKALKEGFVIQYAYPAPINSITAAELASLLEKATLLKEAQEIIDQYKGLASRYKDCKAERDELRKDAARYRWLRDSPESPIINIGYATDKMVDAAIAQGKGE